MGHHQVREVEPADVMVTFFFPVMPHVGEEIRYEPLGRRKVATPVLPVRDERFVPTPMTLTSAFATGCLGVPPPPGDAGPPTSITATLSVSVVPL
jgi:hypothetical protein